jgi:hypothetical protein
MSTKFLDTKDYVPGTSPLRRSITVMFDRVISRKDSFDFYLGKKFVCTMNKDNFDFRQADFFEGISDPM